MLQQIVTHTPLYVWAILGFLVYRGVLASREREVDVKKLCIIPLVMLALSLQSVRASFGMDGAAPLLWLAGTAAGAVLGWRLSDMAGIAADPARGVLRQPGSWMPLAMMLSIFCLKYALAVSLAVAPSLLQQAVFVATACGLCGLFSGVLLGRLLRSLAVYRRSRDGLVRPLACR
jgi:hypothetical protein